MEITGDCATQYYSRTGANGLKYTTNKQPGDRGRGGSENATDNVEPQSPEKQLPASHRVGDGTNGQSGQGARYQPHRNGRLTYLCPDTQAIGDDCYRRDISRDRKLAERGQSGQQEQSSPWGRTRSSYAGICHCFIPSAMQELSPPPASSGRHHARPYFDRIRRLARLAQPRHLGEADGAELI